MIKNPFKKKNKDEQEDLSIIQEYREPVTFASLWKRWVVQPTKAIHDYLQKNGVLFFLLSPFQYKNRLKAKVILIVLGIFLGIIPRTMSMVHDLRERNLSSEIESTQSQTAGNVTVNPLMSGYDASTKTHIIAFDLQGDSNDGVPSTDNAYRVILKAGTGISNTSGMKYQYKVVPVSQTSRLMLLAITGQRPTGASGVYNLTIQAKNDAAMDTPMQVILSGKQKDSALYQNGKIEMSALSGPIINENGDDDSDSKHPIKDALKTINNDISNYQVNEQRLNASGMKLGITTDKLKQLVQQEIAMNGVKDNSTTADLADIDTKQPTQPSVTSSIIMDGKTYKMSGDSASGDSSDDGSDAGDDTNTNSQGVAVASSASQVRNTELPNLVNLISNIQSDISTLNQARINKYNALVGVQGVLNQEITLSSFTTPVALK